MLSYLGRVILYTLTLTKDDVTFWHTKDIRYTFT